MSEEALPPILQYSQAAWKRLEPEVAAEATVALSVNGDVWLAFSCTPVDLEALAVGFLFNEGIIQSAEEVVSARVCAEGTHLDVWLTHTAAKPPHWQRTSGCAGGVTSIQPGAVIQPQAGEGCITPAQLLDAMEQLLSSQVLYRQARGIHCAAMSDGQSVRVTAEDIGRHNTLDQLAGLLLLKTEAFQPRVLLTTGRVSSEMLQKAARMGAQVVVSRTSPTRLSVKMAQQAGITLVGYASRAQFNLYTHPQRVVGAPGLD